MQKITAGSEHAGQSFIDADLRRGEYRDCVFSECDFAGCNLRSADLSTCEFIQCEFNDGNSGNPADLRHTRLREVRFERCNLTVVPFTGCQAYGATFTRCQMQGTDFTKSDFRLPVGDSDLVELNITDCNLSFANLGHNYLHSVCLENNRMLECVLDYCDLTGASLQGSELHGISSIGVTLKEADLRGADFGLLDPRQVDLTGVKIFQSQAWSLLDALGVLVEPDP